MEFNKMMEREYDELIKERLLPHRFKLLGIYLSIGSFVLYIVSLFMAELPDYGRHMISKVVLLSMLMVSISKEKQEDEMSRSLRSQSYMLALVIGVLYAVFQPIINFGVAAMVQGSEASFEELPVFATFWFMLFVQLGFFHVMKKGSA